MRDSSIVTDPRQLPTRPIEQVRERVIEALSEHFARDNISLDDLETRMARVYAATTPHEVDSLLDGLPALATGAPVPVALEPNSPAPKLRERLVAIMSGIVRRGLWRIPRRLRVVAIMGGVQLDLREAELPPGVTEIRAFIFMGGLDVRVAPGVVSRRTASRSWAASRIGWTTRARVVGMRRSCASPASPSWAGSPRRFRLSERATTTTGSISPTNYHGSGFSVGSSHSTTSPIRIGPPVRTFAKAPPCQFGYIAARRPGTASSMRSHGFVSPAISSRVLPMRRMRLRVSANAIPLTMRFARRVDGGARALGLAHERLPHLALDERDLTSAAAADAALDAVCPRSSVAVSRGVHWTAVGALGPDGFETTRHGVTRSTTANNG